IDFVRAGFEAIRLKLVYIRSERVRFDYVGACADVFAMNLAHEIGRHQIQLIVRAIDVDTLCIEHRAHGAVEDVGTIGYKKLLEGFHNKNPAPNNAGLQIHLKFFGSSWELAELFSCLFCVAASRLNSPRFPLMLIRRGARDCQPTQPWTPIFLFARLERPQLPAHASTRRRCRVGSLPPAISIGSILKIADSHW